MSYQFVRSDVINWLDLFQEPTPSPMLIVGPFSIYHKLKTTWLFLLKCIESDVLKNLTLTSYHLVNAIVLHKLPVSYCNFIGMFFTLNKVSDEFDLDLCFPFLKFLKLLTFNMPCECDNFTGIGCIML